MQNLDVSKTADAWAPLSRTLFVPHTESEYRQLVGLLDSLIDEVGEDESHLLLRESNDVNSQSHPATQTLARLHKTLRRAERRQAFSKIFHDLSAICV